MENGWRSRSRERILRDGSMDLSIVLMSVARSICDVKVLQLNPTMTQLPSAATPLYNHPLPQIEAWLEAQGCQQDRGDLHCWSLDRSNWRAELWLDVDQLTVRYLNAGDDGRDVQRSFKYSLSRGDIEAAVFAGP